MNITEELEIVDLALFHKKSKTLILADIHMGYEEALNKQGVLIPRHQFKETMERLKKIVDKLDIETIIINGDLKHEFGKISETEWRHTIKLLDYLLKHAKRIILLKGNHDNILEPIAKKRDLEVKTEHKIDDILFIHGDVLPKELPKCRTIVIGHEHPAVTLVKEPRTETYKCFLKGRFKGKGLIVLPSFNLVTEGTDVMTEKLLSPFLQKDLSNFEAIIVGDKPYYFGKLKEIEEL